MNSLTGFPVGKSGQSHQSNWPGIIPNAGFLPGSKELPALPESLQSEAQ